MNPDNPLPVGEVGVLIGIEESVTDSLAPRCILVMRWKNQDYFGSWFFDDPVLFKQVIALRRRHIGLSIAEIGSMTIPDHRTETRWFVHT